MSAGSGATGVAVAAATAAELGQAGPTLDRALDQGALGGGGLAVEHGGDDLVVEGPGGRVEGEWSSVMAHLLGRRRPGLGSRASADAVVGGGDAEGPGSRRAARRLRPRAMRERTVPGGRSSTSAISA